MKIAVTAEHPLPESTIDLRFGRAKFFLIYDDEMETWEVIENKQNLEAAQGAGIQSAATIVNAGCGALISGHCGPKAFTALSKAGVLVFTTKEGTIKDAINCFKSGNLERIESADVEGHW